MQEPSSPCDGRNLWRRTPILPLMRCPWCHGKKLMIEVLDDNNDMSSLGECSVVLLLCFFLKSPKNIGIITDSSEDSFVVQVVSSTFSPLKNPFVLVTATETPKKNLGCSDCTVTKILSPWRTSGERSTGNRRAEP